MRKLLSLLLVFAVSIFLASCEGKGKIIIKEPPNADVYINGKKVGKTPIELELREGKYDITVETDPFISETKKNVQVYFDKTIVLKFNPTPKGILEVQSNPSGAEVWDNKVYLGNTPLKEKLDPGLHKILLYKGKLSAERKVNIEYRKTTKLFVNLEKAVVHVNASPSDATIQIGNVKINKFPYTLELDEGTYKVIVSKPPYTDEFTLKVKKGDEINVSYTLQPVQLPPVQAYGPIKFTHNKKYLISMGKAGIYFWNIHKFKPEISLYDPEDVRNFDKFINFNITQNDEFVVGIKPIRKLAYALKTKEKNDKIIVWDLKTTAVKFAKLYPIESKYPFFIDSNKILLIEKNGKTNTLDITSSKLEKIANIGETVTSAKKYNNFVIVGTSKGNLFKIDPSNGSLAKLASLSSKVNDIFVTKDGNVYVASDKVYILDGSLKVKTTFNTKKSPLAVAVTPSGKILAVSYGKNVEAFDLKTGKSLYKISNLPVNIISMLFRDEEILITASGIKTPYVAIWKNGHKLKKWVQTIE